jgi:TolB-like protein
MAYPSFVENGDSIIARIRRPYLIPSPTFGYSSVLPFTNLSGDPEQQYFSDGITSALTQT